MMDEHFEIGHKHARIMKARAALSEDQEFVLAFESDDRLCCIDALNRSCRSLAIPSVMSLLVSKIRDVGAQLLSGR